MEKTSIYLTEAEQAHLRELARQSGQSRSELIRAAIRAYHVAGPREFAILGCYEGDGTSIADIDEEELLEGFGEDLDG